MLVRFGSTDMLYLRDIEGLSGTDRTLRMPARGHRKMARRGHTLPHSNLTLVVIHGPTADVRSHVAPLRSLKRYRLVCRAQSEVFSERAIRRVGAVLWESSTGLRPNWRLLRALAGGAPIVGYSADLETGASERSRNMGFLSHLVAPLNPVDVAHQIAVSAPGDMATRWERACAPLTEYLGQVAVFSEMTRRVGASLAPGPVAEAIVDRAAAWLPAPSWSVVATDLVGAPALLASTQLPRGLERSVISFGAKVTRTGRGVGTRDLAGDDGREFAGPSAAAIAMPLQCRGLTIGAVVGVDACIVSSRVPELPDSVRSALSLLFEPAALALDNASRMQRTQTLTVTDDLTQLFNSRYLSEVLHREGRRSVRTRRPLSLLFIDLDGFKEFNNTYGHQCGSRALVEAGAVIRNCVRATDVVARFGGDEFSVVLPDTGSGRAMAVADRVRTRLASHRFLASEGFNCRLTASAGVATLPELVPTVDRLLQAADDAMYRVKAQGKDGIQLADAVA